MSEHPEPVSMLTAMMRGVRGTCPKCGTGKLLASYLTPAATCASCHEELGTLRADDGPPWLTVLIVGHILLPIIFTTGAHSTWPTWLSMTVWLSLAVVLIGLILPRAKGLFMGVMWKNRQIS
jgi:uncharacterized protein (DUF983 family)